MELLQRTQWMGTPTKEMNRKKRRRRMLI